MIFMTPDFLHAWNCPGIPYPTYPQFFMVDLPRKEHKPTQCKSTYFKKDLGLSK